MLVDHRVTWPRVTWPLTQYGKSCDQSHDQSHDQVTWSIMWCIIWCHKHYSTAFYSALYDSYYMTHMMTHTMTHTMIHTIWLIRYDQNCHLNVYIRLQLSCTSRKSFKQCNHHSIESSIASQRPPPAKPLLLTLLIEGGNYIVWRW